MLKPLSNSFRKSPLATLSICAFSLLLAVEVCFAGADISITAANVLSSGQSGGATTVYGTAGTAITQGEVVYKASSGSYLLSSATGAPSSSGTVTGIALNSAAAGQPIAVCTKDPNFHIGSGTLNIGDILCASGSNPGGITLSTNMVAGENIMVLGVATGSNTINLNPVLAGGTNTGTYP